MLITIFVVGSAKARNKRELNKQKYLPKIDSPKIKQGSDNTSLKTEGDDREKTKGN